MYRRYICLTLLCLLSIPIFLFFYLLNKKTAWDETVTNTRASNVLIPAIVN